MKRLVVIFCLCSAFAAYAGESSSTTKTSSKSTKSVQTKKKTTSLPSKREIDGKWTNWSKIKDLFM